MSNEAPIEIGITLAEAARRSGISYSALNWRAMRMHLEPVHRVGERKLYSQAQIDLLLQVIAAGHADAAGGGEVPLGPVGL